MTDDEAKYSVHALNDKFCEEQFPHIIVWSNKEHNKACLAFAGTLADFVALIASSIDSFAKDHDIKKKEMLKAVAVALRLKSK